jgi:trehalose 6-phosphate synthase
MIRITFRLVVALVLAAAIVTAVSTYLQTQQEKHRLLNELNRRAEILSETIQEIVTPTLLAGDTKSLEKTVIKFGNRERLIGMIITDNDNHPLVYTPRLGPMLTPLIADIPDMTALAGPDIFISEINGQIRHIYATPIVSHDSVLGSLILVHDASFIRDKLLDMWRHTFFRLLFNALLISLISLWIIRWNLKAPISQMTEWMKRLRTGDPSDLPAPPSNLFKPLASEATNLAQSLSSARKAAQTEARLRQNAASIWTPELLREHVKNKLGSKSLFVVANREPYMHVRHGRKIDVVTPASGLVTGIEPILLACGGLWLAHGTGDADKDTSDSQGKIQVPPEFPQYTLKRVWLSKEEEEGYYYGFSNEGLWPLCHIAHTRPIFRAEDWKHYQEVNKKFAQSLLEEMESLSDPVVLIQDYHFALLPRLIKEARPDARIAIFWHIPWPNSEAFGICPWQKEILHGMLGADLIGFQIQFHCNNFLETVDASLESRIDWERFAVQRNGHLTQVKPYPISIAFPNHPVVAEKSPPSKDALLKELGIASEFFGIGVDRIDYTKGITERFRGVEKFFEKFPNYLGKFTLVEIGSPSRTHIKRYHDLAMELEAEAERINWKFKTKEWKPIVYIEKHHTHEEIAPFYKTADMCLVTSLHDGMNLVAKEFVASRDDERGTLILSRFTGAARELRDALLVNPYDSEQLADSIRFAIEMPPSEQIRRMQAMRQTLAEQNVYAWAGKLIEDLSKIRTGNALPTKTSDTNLA